MTLFTATTRASYFNSDNDSATEQTLAIPSTWDYNTDYDPTWFTAQKLYPLDDDVHYVIKDREIDILDLYTQEALDALSRKKLALLKYEIWADRNQTFGQVIDDPANPGTDLFLSEMVDITIAKDVSASDPDGTLLKNSQFGSYFGTIIIDGEFFIAVSGTSGSFTLFGSPSDPNFKFPETLDGPPFPTDVETIPFAPIGYEFTNDVDRWIGTSGDDIAGLLGGSDIANGKAGNDIIVGHGGGDRIRGGFGRDDLFGGAGNDDLYGGGGSDLLVGGRGKDLLIGGAGRDILIGGKGNDDFIFKRFSGVDRIKDFDADATREDIILKDVTEITGFRDLKTNHMTQEGKHVVIDDHEGTKIVVLNTDIADMDKTDFIF